MFLQARPDTHIIASRTMLPEAAVERQRYSIHRVEQTGLASYANFMRRYPALTDQQNDTALRFLQRGLGVSALGDHSHFQMVLERERAALYANPKLYHSDPVNSYLQLFADSPTIDFLVAFGNFPLVLSKANQYAAKYPNLPLDLDAVFQKMMRFEIPGAAREYIPRAGLGFAALVKTIADRELKSLVNTTVTQTSIKTKKEPGVKPLYQDRAHIEYLHKPLNEDSGEPIELADTVEDSKAVIPGQHLEDDRLAGVYARAGITTNLDRAIIDFLIFQGEKLAYVAQQLGVSERTVRIHRDASLIRLQTLAGELGIDAFKAFLRGKLEELPSVEDLLHQDPGETERPGDPRAQDAVRRTARQTELLERRQARLAAAETQSNDAATGEVPVSAPTVREDEQSRASVKVTEIEAGKTQETTPARCIEAGVRPAVLPCLACGKDVPQPARKQSRAKQYCNGTCRQAASRERHREEPKQIQCPMCPTLFIPEQKIGGVQKYCCGDCQRKANWQRANEIRKAKRHLVREAKQLTHIDIVKQAS